MCGISGILNLDNKPAESSQIQGMNSLIRHRGPDGDGVFTEGSLGMGSTRLAIIDLRHIADQPMFDSDERYVIVYNGEIFNYIELREELLAKGYKFKNNSDTEVILNSYREYGEDCLNRLNGMWAFAVWDRKEKTLFCSRDRYGIKPFYYYLDRERFIFGSEIKQILSCSVDKSVNDDIVFDYLVFHFIDHTEETFFKNIFKLPAGHKITFKGGSFNLSRWYELPDLEMDGRSAGAIYNDFREKLYDSVRLRLRSDVEVGSCLSGGIDSSSIVCIMNNILRAEGKAGIQKTYTACYDDKEIDEREYVEAVIKQTGSEKYFLFPDSGKFLQDIDRLTYIQDEPYTGATVFAQWSVFKKIHETGLKVVLDGQGADEILLGYFSFFPFHLKRNILNPVKFVSEFINGVNTTGLGISKFTQNLVYFNSAPVRYRHVMNNGRKFLKDDFLAARDRRGLFNRMAAVSSLRANRLSNLWNISLPSLLRYEDRNSMAFSVEARLPFLDHRLVEFIFSVPYGLLIKKGWTKHVLRESMRSEIPESIRMRKGKLAFSVPQKKWMAEIREFINMTFNEDFKAGRFIDRSKISRMMSPSKDLNDKILFRAFALEKWMKVFDLR